MSERRAKSERKSKSTITRATKVTNYYDILPKKFKAEHRTYDAFTEMQIGIPFQAIITGGTGSGKTNALIRMLDEMNCFERYLLFAKLLHEPLYAHFIDALEKVEKRTGLQLLIKSKNIAELPEVHSLNDKLNNVAVIDDMVNEKSKALSRVADYWTLGRKYQCSAVFLTQSYFDTPLIMRKNTSIFIFTKIQTQRDLVMILKDFRLGVTEDQIMDLYHAATKDGFPHFFMVDTGIDKDPKYRFRRDFEPLILDSVPSPLSPVEPIIEKHVTFAEQPLVHDVTSEGSVRQAQKRKKKQLLDRFLTAHFEDQPSQVEDRLIAEETDEQRARRLGASEHPTTETENENEERKRHVKSRLRVIGRKLHKPVSELKRMAESLGLTLVELCDRLEDAMNRGEFDDILYPKGRPNWRPVPLMFRD